MKPSVQTLGEILFSPSQYIIPVFQRQYRWEEPQWKKLWESLEEIQQPTKTGNHFMGFLVFVPGLPQPGKYTTFHLIDGQQRLTSLSILLAAIRNVARQVKQKKLANEIHDYYLVHPPKKSDEHFRLLPKERDSKDYRNLITGKGELSGRVGEAYAFFEEQLSDLAEQGDGRLRDLFNVITQRLEFMCATLESENAYNIFKSLNSTGVPLGQSDLIRNFVFMHLQPDDHDLFDRELWAPLETRFLNEEGVLDEERFSRFFRDYLMSDGDYVAPKNTFATFEGRYEATGFSPRQLAATLEQFADYYDIISGRKRDVSKVVTEALEGLNALESSTTYPLLLKLFVLRDLGQLSHHSLGKAVDMLRGFILRRFITGESSRGYGQLFLRPCKLKYDDSLLELEKFLIARIWPDDRRFKEAFVHFPLYVRGYTFHVLSSLERSGKHKEPVDLSKAQVEHIMPQTLTDTWREDLGDEWERIHTDWLHRPGNLTLTGYNAPLSNSPFGKKRDDYAKSNIGITRNLYAYIEWGESEMRSRGEALAIKAAEIWLGPKESLTAIRTAKKYSDRYELRQAYWSGLREHLETNYDDLPLLEVNQRDTIRMPSDIRGVTFAIWLRLRNDDLGLTVWFGNNAFKVWEQLRNGPDVLHSLTGEKWQFLEYEGKNPYKSVEIKIPADNARDEASWPPLYDWMGRNIHSLYSKVRPLLQEISQGTEVSTSKI